MAIRPIVHLSVVVVPLAALLAAPAAAQLPRSVTLATNPPGTDYMDPVQQKLLSANP